MIISCSRRTDIPSFYSNWFFNRLREGFADVRNPMNTGQVRRVSLVPADVEGIVFWTKDPLPMLDRLHLLDEYPFYFQFSLTPYGPDIEPFLPPKTRILETFLLLSGKIGPRRMIWRYDPILLSDQITIDYHIDRFGEMARQLAGCTERCVISFLDMYRHIHSRMAGLSVRSPDESEMRALAQGIGRIAGGLGIRVETCAEKIDLDDLDIGHGKCVDDRLMAELAGRNLQIGKDKYQREICGCVSSVDIGQYNTCGHLCRYCYANISPQRIEKNRLMHSEQSPLLTGNVSDMKSTR